MEKRSTFSNKLGFVLAAAGSAVGLGNIWRFPYLAAEYGGGIFLLVYVILVVTVGFTLMMSEIAIGRKTGLSPIKAYGALNKKYSWMGIFGLIVPMIILPYYCVIGGWVIKYLVGYVSGAHAAMAGEGFFDAYIGQGAEPVIWLLVFLVATTVVVLGGVKKGIEKANRIMMPILIVLSVAVAVYSLTLPGAMDGFLYFITPDFSHFSVNTVLAALGQMFYSLSLAMGIMITYGSYIKKDVDLSKSVKQIEIFDTVIAVLAGLMIIPAVFAFSGGNQDALSTGPGLMFDTLPKVFESMGLSSVVGCLFFLLVLFAALTSSISIMEAIVSCFQDKFHLSRKKAVLIVTLIAAALAIPTSLGNGVWSGFTIFGMDLLTFFDFISNSVLMPIGAFLTCIFVGYIITPQAVADEVSLSAKFKREKMYRVLVKYIAPICICAILVSSVLNSLGVITI